MDLQGCAAIVTGSATGIGAETAKLLAAKGCNVIVNYSRSKTEAEETADECRKAGADVLLVAGDVSKDEDCRALAKAALDKWKRIDVLVNSAGRTKAATPGDYESLCAQDFHDVYAVNVIGAYQMIRAVVPAMKAAGNGAIVSVSALAALTGEGSSIAYAASKGAANALTKSLAKVLAPEVRVNAVAPALVEGGFVERLAPESFADRAARQKSISPLQRLGKPDEVAEAIWWLVAGDTMMTGSILDLDFGVHLTSG